MVYFSKWKIILVLAVVALGFVFATPNVMEKSTAESIPTWLPHKQVNLGLDLQGGSHLLLEVETDVVIKEQLESIVDGVRASLRRDGIRYTGLGVRGLGVGVTVRDPANVEKAVQLIRDIDNGIEVDTQGNRIILNLSDDAITERRNNALAQSIEIVRRRVDETGTREPTIQRQGDSRILLQLPGVEDPERVKRLLGRTAKMTFHLLCENQGSGQGRVPPGCMELPDADAANPQSSGTYLVRRRVAVSGDRLVDAQASFSAQTNEPVVTFRFDTLGGKRFGDITRDNVGRPFAIVLDDKVISAPVIREPILGGNGQISGNFTVTEANDLALLLRAGALPAPLNILEERTVGPGLGADSIAAGKVASIIGLIAVIVFMILVYGLFGVFANVALAVNMILILAALSLFQATLTLPGIAGIVLTIGMAVDANVLIFERIKEEVRAGRTPISAIDAGYGRAITTIIDANLTTLIAALILFSFGSGPIKGFAVTLSIGIVTSMFTAIMLTRLLIVSWLRRRRPAALPVV